MTRHLLSIIFILFSTLLFAQPYGNEWINHSQTYYKFPITQTGIYRITFNDMSSAGIPLQTINSKQLQVFGREKEVPLFVQDGGDNMINPGDYLEFFAEKNDGWLDSLLYTNPQDIGNPGYSLFSDTIYYFLTWTTSTATKRFSEDGDINFTPYTPIPYVLQTTTINYNNQYYGGFSQYDAYSSLYSAGEGWGSSNYNGANGYNLAINVSTPSLYTGTGSPNAIFHGKSNANSNASFTGTGNHHLRWEVGSSNYVIHDEVFIGYRQTVVNATFPVSHLNNGTSNFQFKIIGDQGAATDYQSVNFLSLTYPRTTETNNTFINWKVLKNTTEAKSRVDLIGATLTNPVAYILGTNSIPKKLTPSNDGGIWKVLVPNSIDASLQLIIASQEQIKPIQGLTPVNGNGKFIDYQAFNSEKAYIILYNKVMQASVEHYATYRQSANGGAHNVILVEAEDAWLQYGAGIPKHILGVSRALNEIYNLTTEKPEALFIAGKGIMVSSYPNTGAASAPRKNSTNHNKNLVPTYGFPASDNLITAKWNGSTSFAPAIPTGRIAANNNAQLELYLLKVQIYEAQQNQTDIYNKPNKDWQKQVIHFGGGSNAGDQALFKYYLEGYKTTIKGPHYGGNVHSFYKTTSDPFNPVQTQEVSGLIQNGVSLMTFFGHASSDGFDQNLDEPENWGNSGKYPMVIGNGCYTGNIYKPDNNSTAEDFVFIQDLGAIGFLSTSELGFASQLNTFSSELYRQISPLNYGATIGQQIRATNQTLANNYSNNFMIEVTAPQYILHGDPGIKLNWHAKPEIDLTPSDVSFGPSQFTLTTDSIYVETVLTNLGRSILDTFSFTVTRHFPNSSVDSIYFRSVYGLDYKDTVRIGMPLQPSIAAGLNNFTIQADIPSFVPEQYDEYGNNEIKASFFINIDGIIPVWPHNYAVVPRDSVVVKASTVNPIAPFNTYRFEIDTTDLYNSPFRKYAIVSGLGGVKEVHPDEWLSGANNLPSQLVLEDSVSYYWRVGVDSSEMSWREYSFQYIPNKRGWGQAHFFQFKNGTFNGIEYDRPTRQRNFNPQQFSVSAHVHDSPSNDAEFNSTIWQLNGINAEYGMCSTSPMLHVGVVNPATMDVWRTSFNGANPEMNFGNLNNGSACRNRSEKFFLFQQNSTSQLQKFTQMLDAVPDGHVLVIYTANKAMYNQWQTYYPQIFTTLTDLGAEGITPGAPNRAFIFIVQKGNPASAQTVHAQYAKEFIHLNVNFDGAVGNGVETSTIIGPSLEWKTVYWKQESMEEPTNDETRLIIRGLDINKQVGIEIDTVFTSNDSILYLNNLIPAEHYPFLQLQARYQDLVTVTPAQVKRWHVLYEDVPEAAIDGTNGFVFLPTSADSLLEGVTVKFAVDVKNISDLHMDSLLVHYWAIDKNQIKHPIPYPRQDSLRVEQVIRDTISFSTVGMNGLNYLWMEVNPYTKGPNLEYEDQPELAHFNNILQIPFHIAEDEMNPILDVTFDGEHILNGDIISPFSHILISLQDENPFLVMNEDADTTNFGIYLTSPSGIQKRIPFMDGSGNPVLQWIPANESNLRFKILYEGNFEETGTYELLVQGSDRAGNLSGDLEYRVKFEIVLESAISHLMNYPNPFSTSTRFVFTLTGSEIPDDIIIQIMTVTGRIVREITEQELGPIHIGRNITEYAWDGRDEFGDQLANGVYLYRVKAKINGEDIEHLETGADKHFKRNWGKMYLMR